MNWPLMQNNIPFEDLNNLAGFLLTGENPSAGNIAGPSYIPRLTNGAQVRAFEEEFAAYIGTKYACMVNSGASANVISMAALRGLYGTGKVLVPVIGWVSDITAIMQAGLTPEFCDVEPDSLGLKFPKETDALAMMAVHCLGFASRFNDTGPLRGMPLLIEDCCESLGAVWHDGRKFGSFGLASNFSFYYAHHMTTVEGGMICTNDRAFHESCRMLRGHGLLRECDDEDYRMKVEQSFPDLDPQFIFVMAGYNMRPTEIQAVLGRSQLKRLDANVAARSANLRTFLAALDPSKYRTRYRIEGSSNYALPLILQEKHPMLLGRVLGCLQAEGVEYRRGTAGGGNQLRQPYLRKIYGDLHKEFPQAEHIHDFGLYLGNYPGISAEQIQALCEKLNAL